MQPETRSSATDSIMLHSKCMVLLLLLQGTMQPETHLCAADSIMFHSKYTILSPPASLCVLLCVHVSILFTAVWVLLTLALKLNFESRLWPGNSFSSWGTQW
eukprot:c14189_g1_i1 orf=612-917(+)